MVVSSLHDHFVPYRIGRLRVSELHQIHYEESGAPNGFPVVVLHGGPGGASNAGVRRFFDPMFYRVVSFDQRGCGRSTPHACLEENTTAHLIADIEALREELGIDQWAVFGGSWGSTLALAYAQAHPQRAAALFLRGVFLCRQRELNWFYNGGTEAFFPDVWRPLAAAVPEAERGDLIAAYYRRLTQGPERERGRYARLWARYEAATSALRPDPERVAAFGEGDFALAFARIETHYFVNGGFLEEGQLLRDAHRMAHIPGVIVQGRYDMVTPPISAYDLHAVWPAARLEIVPDAGHSSAEPGVAAALLQALNDFRDAAKAS